MDLLGQHDGLTVVTVVPGLLTMALVAGMIGLVILGASFVVCVCSVSVINLHSIFGQYL